MKYWKSINNKYIRIYDCNIENPTLEAKTLQEQIRSIIDAAGLYHDDVVKEVMSYEKIPLPCDIQEVEQDVNSIGQILLPEYELKLSGSIR